jgi:hypothetical protein
MHFGGIPSALGTDTQQRRISRLEPGSETFRRLLVEHEPDMGRIFGRGQQGGKRHGEVDFRDRDSPALFAGFPHDALPAIHPRSQPGLWDAHGGKGSLQWKKSFNSELRPLLQDPLESIRLDQRSRERERGYGRFGKCDLPERAYADFSSPALDDSGVAETRAIEELHLFTRTEPQDGTQVVGLVGCQNGNPVLLQFLWDKKSPSGHGHLLPEDILHLLEDIAFVRDLIILVQVRKALEELPLLFGELRRDDNIHSDELIAPPALIQADDAFIA